MSVGSPGSTPVDRPCHDHAEGGLGGQRGGGGPTSGVDDEPGVHVTARGQQPAAPPHVSNALDTGRAMVDVAREVGAQGVVVEDPVGALDDVAPMAVDHHGRRCRREAARREVGDVVAPRAVRRRPRATLADDHDGDAGGSGGGGQCQPGRAVADDGEIDGVDGVRQRSSAAMRRNCSTTSGLRWVGSRVR